MNKKGQGLPLNTIVIAILVIIVLVLLVTFFLGGFRGLTSRIAEIFFGTTMGMDMTLAVQNCETYCDNAKLLPSDDLKKLSPYCKREMKIDTTGDGEADKIYNCRGLGVSCPGVEDIKDKDEKELCLSVKKDL